MRGGYQIQSRLMTHLDEIRMEATVARASMSRCERNRAFEEIQRLAHVCAELLERVDVRRQAAVA